MSLTLHVSDLQFANPWRRGAENPLHNRSASS